MYSIPSLLLGLALSPVPLTSPPAEDAGAREPDSLEDVYERVHRSVVTLYTAGSTGLVDDRGEVQTEEGVGSGVLIEGDRILTAAHVVQTADEVVVEFVDGTRAPARVVSSKPYADVAVLKLGAALPEGLAPAALGDSDQVKVASRIFVVGAPLGISHTLTVGHVSARRRTESPFGEWASTEHFQTDAAINPGNSGGPMFNLAGEVVGVVSYIVSRTGEYSGLGFAVTSNAARRILLDRNPFWSGMSELYVSGPLARALNVPEDRSGLLVQRVGKGSPADRLGLRGGSIPAVFGGQEILLGGDIILEALGIRLEDAESLAQVLQAAQSLTPETVVRVVVLRSGRIIEMGQPLEMLVDDSTGW